MNIKMLKRKFNCWYVTLEKIIKIRPIYFNLYLNQVISSNSQKYD